MPASWHRDQDGPVPDAVPPLDGMAPPRAIRRYRPEPVPDEALATMLFAATRAPTGSNRQPFRFIVLRDGPNAIKAKRLLGDAAAAMWSGKRADDGYDERSGQDPNSPKARMARTMQHYSDHLPEAPVVVLACLVRYRRPNEMEGASIYPACQNLLLAARALGYGGVLTGLQGFVEDDLRQLLGIPEGVFVAATITIGRPAGKHGPVRRRPLAELVYEDGWEQPADWAVDPPGTQFTSAGPPSSAANR